MAYSNLGVVSDGLAALVDWIGVLFRAPYIEVRELYSPGATACESLSSYIEEKARLLTLEPRAINMSVLVA